MISTTTARRALMAAEKPRPTRHEQREHDERLQRRPERDGVDQRLHRDRHHERQQADDDRVDERHRQGLSLALEHGPQPGRMGSIGGRRVIAWPSSGASDFGEHPADMGARVGQAELRGELCAPRRDAAAVSCIGIDDGDARPRASSTATADSRSSRAPKVSQGCDGAGVAKHLVQRPVDGDAVEPHLLQYPDQLLDARLAAGASVSSNCGVHVVRRRLHPVNVEDPANERAPAGGVWGSVL